MLGKPEELLSQGKKAYNSSDYETALIKLSKACKSFGEIHGDMSDLMLEPHFYYAQCLYEYAKQDTDALNNIDEDAGKLTEISTSDNETDEEDKDERESKEKQESDYDDVSSFQLAFENIECAKLILERQLSKGKHDKKELELKLADCYKLAGHILMEDDLDEECMKEYNAALQIHLKYDNLNSIAEIYMFLGIACSNQYKCHDAKDYYEKCKQVLEKVTVTLDKAGMSCKKHQEFVANIDQRLEDVKDALKDVTQAAQILKTLLNGDSSVVDKRKAIPDIEVNDLNSCVRKKPKLVETPSFI